MLVRRPFTQLFSVHAFVRHGDCSKQIPLAYVLMSGKRLIDYSTVIIHLLECLQAQPIVTHVMADYELSPWQAFWQVLPQCKMSGCLFYFCQAIYRNIQLLGLVRRYLDDPVVNGIAKSIMALPLLRVTDIIPTLQVIQTETQHIQQLHPFITYVQHQWIHRHFTPTDISLIGLKSQDHYRSRWLM